jgi:2-keto-4-pentenoate hydratase/2-oxohepta-3-ene-1,7-dioic acid hydratase in catechol pathway
MRICRFDDDRVGIVRGEKVFDVTSLGRGRLLQTAPADLEKRPTRTLSSLRLLSPVPPPGKVLAAPVNYKGHIAEMKKNNPSPGHNIWDLEQSGLFLKAPSSIVGPSQGIAQRFRDRRTDFELELVAVIGREAKNVSRHKALEYVAGYCLGIDVTLRGSEDRSFRKSIDSYTVLGPWLTTADEVPDPQKIRISIAQNGKPRQEANTSDMHWDVAHLIEFASQFYTLHPGDVFFTGTPSGVGPIKPGDRLVASSDLLGTMEVEVREYK